MFSCCRCTNAKENKDDKKSKKNKTETNNETNIIETKTDHSKDIIEIRLKPDIEQRILTKIEENSPTSTTSEKEYISNNTKTSVRNKSDSNNSINEEESNSKTLNNSSDDKISDNINNIVNSNSNNNKSNVPNEINDIITTISEGTTLHCNGTTENETPKSETNTIHNGVEYFPKSCISRRSSSKSSIRKKVNINDSTEVIPSSDLASMDDDEVFSDSIPPKIPRGDMCAPYIQKRGSFQGYFGFLPEWFNEDRFYTTNEQGGILEPPVTPVGRDELALKRHRLYSELLMAAQAAVEHRVRFDPLGPDIAEDCDPDLKPSVAANLENLVNRLERLVERLERSISARELEIANKTFDSVIETKRRSFDIEAAELPPIPTATTTDTSLDKRIDRLEDSLSKINDSFKKDSSCVEIINGGLVDGEGSLENIPTVLDEYLTEDIIILQEQELLENMSVNGYQDIVSGPLAQYIELSNKIGGDVAKHAQLVKQAFDAQLHYVTTATQCAKPPSNKELELLKPTSDQIAAIQNFREKNRTSQFFNHLSAISESIPALGWVCVSPTPGPHVKEMNDAGQFYTNRVLKDWKEKNVSHVEWARAWIQTLTDLQKYIKQYHTTGLVWSGKGQAGGAGGPPPPPPGCPPPPPPPVLDMSALALNASGAADDRSALFAEINRGENVTKGLKKVTADMQTHKNPTLRTGPAPFKTPASSVKGAAPAPPVDKPPVFNKDGKKWIIEYQKSNPNLLIDQTEMNNVIYMFKCENSTLTVKGKVNSVFMDSCKKCSLVIDSVVASIEFVNCQSSQMQVLNKCPTISIDKTDGCQMYLSKDSLDVAIISSKSSEMNVMIPKGNGDYTEQPIPEQYKTLIKGNSLQTTCVESLG